MNGDRIRVYREAYPLLTQVFEITVNIRKDFKVIPGEDIKWEWLELVRNIFHANDVWEETLRISFIRRALELDEDIKLLLRIICDLKQKSPVSI